MRQTLTRGSVVSTAREMLEADGLDGVSLRRIASRLGVTAPALYAYVTDKLDLLQAIAQLELERLLERFRNIGDDDPLDRLRGYARTYLEYALENAALFRAIFLFRPELTAEPRDGEPALAERVLEVVSWPVREAIENGQLRPMEPRLAVVTVWTVVHGAVTMLLTGPRIDEDPERLMQAVVNAVLTGLGAEDQHRRASSHAG